MLVLILTGDGSSSSNSTTTLSTEDIKENAQIPLDDLQPFVLKALNELISFVHRNVNLNENLSTKQTTVKDEPEGFQTAEVNLLDDDPVASFLLAIKPLVLKQILLVMVVCLIFLFNIVTCIICIWIKFESVSENEIVYYNFGPKEG